MTNKYTIDKDKSNKLTRLLQRTVRMTQLNQLPAHNTYYLHELIQELRDIPNAVISVSVTVETKG